MFSPSHDDQKNADTPYVALAGPPLNLPKLRGDLVADAVVVGGGIAGCSATLHAAEAGSKVVLLESMTIGWGASSRNSGHLPPATKQEPDEIIATYGRVLGERIIAASDTAPAVIQELTERHKIDCALRLVGHLTGAHTPDKLKYLEKRVAFWQRRNRPLEILDRDEFSRATGTDFYFGGVLDRRGGSINPLAYVRGLARAAQSAGAQLFENSPATSLTRDGDGWRVSTAEGTVRAKYVLLCTNAHTDDLWPGLRTSVVPVRVIQIYTEPMSSEAHAKVLPGRQPLIDTQRVMNSARVHDNGSLHFGMGVCMRPSSAPTAERAMKQICSLFPYLTGLKGEGWWAGWMAFNPYQSWQMHNPAPGVFSTLGCNGRGVLLATMYGRDLGRIVAGASVEELTLPITPIRKVPFHSFSVVGISVVRKWYRFRDSREVKRARRSTGQ